MASQLKEKSFVELETARKLLHNLPSAVNKEQKRGRVFLAAWNCVTESWAVMALDKWISCLNPFTFNQCLKSVFNPTKKRWMAKANMVNLKRKYPWTVRESGLRITWARAETASVESKPSPPCKRTAAVSWSMHCETKQAQFNVSLTYDSHWEDSKRESHLSMELPLSKQAENVRNWNFTVSLSLWHNIIRIPSTSLDSDSRRDWSLSIGLWMRRHCG